MQCKDIPDKPILEFLVGQNPRWTNWFGPFDGELPENSVLRAMPSEIPGKLGLAKMKQLIKRDLVEGCTCGCGGDFVITDKGRQFLLTLAK